MTLRIILKSNLKTLYSAMKADMNNNSEYEKLFKMETHSGERDEESEIKYLVIACLLYRILEDCEFPMDDLEEVDVLEILHRLMQVQDVNTHLILSLDESHSSQVGLIKIGNAINVNLGSILNHR